MFHQYCAEGTTKAPYIKIVIFIKANGTFNTIAFQHALTVLATYQGNCRQNQTLHSQIFIFYLKVDNNTIIKAIMGI